MESFPVFANFTFHQHTCKGWTWISVVWCLAVSPNPPTHVLSLKSAFVSVSVSLLSVSLVVRFGSNSAKKKIIITIIQTRCLFLKMAIFRFFLIREKLVQPISQVFIYLYSYKCNFLSGGEGGLVRLVRTSSRKLLLLLSFFGGAEVCDSLVSDTIPVVIPPISLQLSPL